MILSSNLSSILQKYKLESTSGLWWVKFNGKLTLLEKKFCWSSKDWGRSVKKITKSYFLSDLIRQSEKVFGNEGRGKCLLCGSTPGESCDHANTTYVRPHKYHAHHITDLLLSNTSQETIEKYIISNLGER